MRRIAVVGSGVAGLTASYVAARTAEVTLYEADDRLGGHADTHAVRDVRADGSTQVLGVDTGFIVHNPRTYPVLLRMFAELGVATQPSEMSMSIRDDETGLEWAGALGRRGLFPTGANLRNPRYLAMLVEIPRFHRRAKAVVTRSRTPSEPSVTEDVTLREFLRAGRFSAYFVRHFMEPLVAAVWSCDPEVALDYPARYLFTFLEHHGMLGVFGSPQWRTVTGGSGSYVEKVAAGLHGVRLGTKVTSVLETATGVEITDGNGELARYDAAVIAAHPGQALGMLAEPTATQRELLGAMPYSANTALLHTDSSVLPEAGDARASWNFRRPLDADARPGEVMVTYDLTRLQRLPTETPYLVTLGGEHVVDPSTVIARREYEHPLYNPESVAAQERLPEISSERLAFAGAYHGWGFHEDGARSGLNAVERIGLSWPETSVSDSGPTTPDRTTPGSQARPGVFETTVRHTRRRPFKRAFTHRTHTWLVDLDDLPDHGVLGRFESRDHLGDPERTIRENVEIFLAEHSGEEPVDLRGGRILMAANARALGHCFNPISVFWCFAPGGALAATLVEVHNTYGDRHAYLVHPDEQGRARTEKAMYVSPFHGTDGWYDLAVPVPDERLHVAVTLHSDDGARFSASLDGRRAAGATTRAARRAAPAALRGSVLIRLHGVVVWLRRLPIRPRPPHHQEGV